MAESQKAKVRSQKKSRQLQQAVFLNQKAKVRKLKGVSSLSLLFQFNVILLLQKLDFKKF
ncbi:MAG: hypothetical protein C0433_04565 [Cyclobacterium sp.]|nr:hypothetical protein [Cyclobacterium sp.]